MRGDGRDMGGIKIISPVPKPLSTKAIPAMMGEMEIFLKGQDDFSYMGGVLLIFYNKRAGAFDFRRSMSSNGLNILST